MVGQTDDDGVDVGVVDRLLDARGRRRDAPASAERLTALDRARVDDGDPIAAAPAVQGHRVEVADQAGAEHGDTVPSGHADPPLIRTECLDI